MFTLSTDTEVEQLRKLCCLGVLVSTKNQNSFANY